MAEDRSVVPIKEGRYNNTGLSLVVAKDEHGTVVSASAANGLTLSWVFDKNGVFKNLAAGTSDGAPCPFLAQYLAGLRDARHEVAVSSTLDGALGRINCLLREGS